MSWQTKAQAKLRRRKTFEGIEGSCPHLSTGQFKQWSAEEQGILRAAMNGTFYTQDKHQGESNHCRYCGHTPDGQYHRLWECQVFEPQRKVCVDDVRARVPHLPQSLTVHGWVPRPSAYLDLKEALLRAPDTTDHVEYLESFMLPHESREELHLFLDGGCLHPQCHLSRLAAWAITAPSDNDPWTFVPLAAGVTPGWHQSAARGELTAAVAALKVVNHVQRPATLWSDNARVVRGVELLRQGIESHDLNRKDADLWTLFSRLIQVSAHLFRGIHKVASHQRVETTTSVAERWVFAGNSSADALVEQTLRDTPLRELCDQVARETAEAKHLRGHIHATIVRVGKQAVLTRNQQMGQEEATVPEPAQVQRSETCITFPRVPPDRAAFLWHAGTERIWAWARAFQDSSAMPVYVSWTQLFLSYVLATSGSWCRKMHPPVQVPRTRRWEPAIEGRHAVQPFASQVQMFARYLRSVLYHCGSHCHKYSARPHSTALLYWQNCLLLRPSAEKLQEVDDMLLKLGPPSQTAGAVHELFEM